MSTNQAQLTPILDAPRGAEFGTSWDNVRAQNGPGIAVVEHRPGPDLSASLDYTEEH